MGPYIYVLISAIAVFPILFVFKITMERIKSGDNDDSIGKVQVQFFMWCAIIEMIPILLIVFAFSSGDVVSGFEEILAPGLLVLVFMAVSTLFTFLQGKVDVPEEHRQHIQSLSFMGMAMANAIPILSLVGLFMMLP